MGSAFNTGYFQENRFGRYIVRSCLKMVSGILYTGGLTFPKLEKC
jgi:hypothetical protein